MDGSLLDESVSGRLTWVLGSRRGPKITFVEVTAIVVMISLQEDHLYKVP